MKQPCDLSEALDIIPVRCTFDRVTESQRNGTATQPIITDAPAAAPEDEIHLLDYWRTIRKRLWPIIGLAVIVSTLAAIKQHRLADIYQARARVQVDTESLNPALGASKGAYYNADNSYMDPEYFNTQIQILSSPTLLRRVVRNLDLQHNPTFLDSRRESRSPRQGLTSTLGFGRKTDQYPTPTILTLPETSNPTSTDDTPAPDDEVEIERLAPFVDTLLGMLEVEQVKKTHLIDIRASHTDPAVAAKVVNAAADAFALWNLEVKTKTNTVAGAYLQKRIAELQSQIRNGEAQLVNYARGHEIVSLDANQNTVVERLSGLNRILLEAENERNLAEAAYHASLLPGAAGVSAEVADKSIVELRIKLGELKQKREQLRLTDTDESPELEAVNNQVATLEKQLTEIRGDAAKVIIANLETNYRKALDREQALRNSFAQQRAETIAQNQAAVNYNILKQEIEANKNLLAGIMQRAKENDVTMAGTPNNIRVVDYAAVPKGPIGPRRGQGVLLALAFALAFGVALSLLLEYLDDTVRNTADIEGGLRLPSLAIIPIAGKTTLRFLPLSRLLGRSGNSTGQELLINTNGPTAQTEAYKRLRTAILLSPGSQPKTLLVTSSVPAEGKTTTAVNTATVLAQTGARVLLIDCDLRRPRLHQIFGLSNDDGLSAILSGEITEAAMLSKINQYEQSNLYLLAAGAIPPNPAELLGSLQMKQLLDLASRRFSHIVIDSPPIGSFTDGVLIASLVDGVILVVQAGATARQVVKRSRQTLNEIGARIMGVVLNRAEVRQNDYYYYQYHCQAHESVYAHGEPPSAIRRWWLPGKDARRLRETKRE